MSLIRVTSVSVLGSILNVSFSACACGYAFPALDQLNSDRIFTHCQ